MAYKKIIPYINGENELPANIIMQAEQYCFAGADALFIYNYSKMEKEREEFLAALEADCSEDRHTICHGDVCRAL